jgi:hypothetical protein
LIADSFMRTDPCYEEILSPVTSAPLRDQFDDDLITPENAAFLFIDYQPSQLATVRSMDPRTPAQERGLNRPDHQDLRSPGRALDCQRRQRPVPTLPELAVLMADDANRDQGERHGRQRADRPAGIQDR